MKTCLSLFLAVLCSCAGLVPEKVKRLEREYEGSQTVQDQALIGYLEGLTAQLSGKKAECRIADSPLVQGHSAGMQRIILVSRGMLNMVSNEAELACFLGHELGHIQLKHYEQEAKPSLLGKAITSALIGAVASAEEKELVMEGSRLLRVSKFSREKEEEADFYGAVLAAKKGYDPYAFCDLFDRISSQVFKGASYHLGKVVGTHNALDRRSKALRKFLEKEGYRPGEGNLGTGAYRGMAARLEPWNEKQRSIENPIRAELARYKSELLKLKAEGKQLKAERFLSLMRRLSELVRIHGDPDVQSGGDAGARKKHWDEFMEEAVIMERPWWSAGPGDPGIAVEIDEIVALVGQVGVGLLPGIGDAIDFYELLEGREFFSGEDLGPGARMLSAVGVLVGSGSLYREGSEKISQWAKRAFGQTGRVSVSEIRRSLEEAEVILLRQTELRRLSAADANNDFLKQCASCHPPYRERSYVYEARLAAPLTVYRVHMGNVRGQWALLQSPVGLEPGRLKNYLSLTYLPRSFAEVSLPRGAKIRYGLAAKIEGWGDGGMVQLQLMEPARALFKDMGGLK